MEPLVRHSDINLPGFAAVLILTLAVMGLFVAFESLWKLYLCHTRGELRCNNCGNRKPAPPGLAPKVRRR
jgi:hypothetical protein